MRKRNSTLFYFVSAIVLGWTCSLSAGNITVAALQHELSAADKPTVIDIRQSSFFAVDHIPGAINIPATLCPAKNLPPLGKVVVYGDGLGPRGLADVQKAVTALSQKPGITVDVLAGGYAAWQSANAPTTAGRGLKPERFNYISYNELQAMNPADAELVDLRKLNKEVMKNASSLTDLSREFPGRRSTHSMSASTGFSASGSTALLVLIDSGDGTSEATARLLKAQGNRHYVILMGGELTIQRKGKAGLERSGGGGTAANIHQSSAPPGHTTGS
ncbi:MAG TPA: rhodanese-like domain-containing protein [Verrucomicrobiae bacterium]|jgi:rhodanese-related sulfurtransferase|nr:rhodanese-like domain-containing protein [Verrucomicrobiae bacterium]